MSKKNLTTIVNSEGVSAETLKPKFEAYMRAVKENHPGWSDEQLAASARDWEQRNGFEPGTFELPVLEVAKDPAPEGSVEIPIEHDEVLDEDSKKIEKLKEFAQEDLSPLSEGGTITVSSCKVKESKPKAAKK